MTTQAMIRADELKIVVARFLRWLTLGVAVFALAGLLFQWYQRHYMLYVNVTESLPGKVYWVVKSTGAIAKGDIVAFYRPETAMDIGPDIFLKIIGGVAGDVVSVNERREFFVNGESKGVSKPKARNGSTLELGPTGVIPSGYVYVFTPYIDSYDSRYRSIGWIDEQKVIGRAYRLF